MIPIRICFRAHQDSSLRSNRGRNSVVWLFHMCVSPKAEMLYGDALKWHLPFSYNFQILLLERNPYQLCTITYKAITHMKLQVFLIQLKVIFFQGQLHHLKNGSNGAREMVQWLGHLPCLQLTQVQSLVSQMVPWACQEWSVVNSELRQLDAPSSTHPSQNGSILSIQT